VRIVSLQDLSGAISFESNTPAVSEVAVWATRSLLTHTTVSPSATLSACGRNCMPSIVTVWVTGRGAVAAARPMADSTMHRAPANMTVRMPVLRGKDRASCGRRRNAPKTERSGDLEPHRCAHRAIRSVDGFQTETSGINVKCGPAIRYSRSVEGE